MMILDSYLALETLSTHPNIDINRVGITGWSLGGTVSLYSAWMPLINSINNGKYRFAAHLPIYPGCLAYPYPDESMIFSQSPVHILIGELDNWTPAKPCEEFVGKLKDNSNINLTIYEDSHHSFDKDSPVIRNENAYNFSDCLFKLTEDGDVLMNYFNIPMSNSFLQKIGFMFCVSRGVNYGGNPESRQKSFDFARKFMRETLLEH